MVLIDLMQGDPMPKLPRPLFALLCALFLALSALPGAAQWDGWDTANGRLRPVTAGVWTVLPPQDPRFALSIQALAMNRGGRLTLSCGPGDARPELVFDQYDGSALPRPVDAREISALQVALVIDGRPFAAVLAYDISRRRWSGEAPWDAGFWDAFAWGQMMTLRNGAGDVVSRFQLRGSRQARRAVRRSCGL